MARDDRRRRSHRVIAGGRTWPRRKAPASSTSRPGCGKDRLRARARTNGLPPVAPLDDDGVFLDGFGPLTGKNAVDPATADAVFEELKKKDRAVRHRALRPPLPALLALQDGAALPPRGRVVHQHGPWQRARSSAATS